MNQENTFESAKTWQKLLCQAFQQTTIKTGKSGISSLFNIHQFVYQSLQISGIENNSPFSLLQLVQIRLNSKGDPQQIRQLCVDTVLNMTKPSFVLQSNNSFLFITFSLSLIMLLTPITANTFKPQKATLSILKVAYLPWQDIESDIISLPLTSDYLTAATFHKPVAEDKPPGTLNASAWILEQKDSSYGLQLLSVSNKANLVKFCEKHDICEQSAFYSTQVNGKTLVRLIYGSYSNHKAAKLAKSKLSVALKSVSPWARSFKTIKNELSIISASNNFLQ